METSVQCGEAVKEDVLGYKYEEKREILKTPC